MMQLKSKGCETVEVDQVSGNGRTTRCDYRGTVAREKEVVGKDDEVSRVQEIVAGRSDVIRRGYDGKYAPDEAMVGMEKGKVGVGSKEEGMNQGVNSQQIMMTKIQKLDGVVDNTGLASTVNGPKGVTPNINLDVILEGLQVGPQPSRLQVGLGSDLSDCVAQTQLRPSEAHVSHLSHSSMVKRAGKNSKNKAAVSTKGNISRQKGIGIKKRSCSVDGLSKQRSMVGRLGFQRGALFKASAVAAAAVTSLSSSQSHATQRRKNLIEEAQATVKIGKLLGLQCQGNSSGLFSVFSVRRWWDAQIGTGQVVPKRSVARLLFCYSASDMLGSNQFWFLESSFRKCSAEGRGVVIWMQGSCAKCCVVWGLGDFFQ
ncbi:hypothetical protein LOK49_LG11G02367 [Camellia lanceoleosa]|uniref:Uncharacterized protein n=1 Tax=Camellia lanceoleosa TaxID=1840588 RepID=A0ACC0G7E7_9ERIC|nr:hypothetical protein LOK49_LG11G02367 [Camellia lanceoleosa]